MKHEIAFMGLYFPSLLLCAIMAGFLWIVADRAVQSLAGWSLFWHPPLARLALYFALFGAVSALYPDF